MKALLMHRDRDFVVPAEVPREQRYRVYGPTRQLSPHEAALMQDLELETVLGAMAAEDAFLYEVARRAFLAGLTADMDTILYRQAILKDCLKNPAVVRELYNLTVETINAKKKHWWGISSHFPGSILHSAVDLMQMLMDKLRTLRGIAEANAARFDSEGFTSLFAMLEKELSDEYFASVQGHLTELKFRAGVLVSGSLGAAGNAVTGFVLREDRDKRPSWLKRILRKGPPAYTFHLHPRDEAGATIVSRLRDRGINTVANALAQSTGHVLSFFEMLRVELAFYVGCLNLRDKLAAMGCPTCFPEPQPPGSRRHRFTELYDVDLALTMGRRVVGNTVGADGKDLVIITGANQGGKSSFLRGIGLAQVMLQCGMFVGAEAFAAEACTGLFTHYKREEDATMTGGKLDEEIRRMGGVADAIGPQSLMLFNESFASTNEREGSEIARQVVRALLEKRVKVFFVTHLYQFAHSFVDRGKSVALFLRAERLPDGTRTFKLIEGEPLETSYGEDLYRRLFAS
jgi:MutS-like protein